MSNEHHVAHDSASAPFASRSLTEHVLRGLAGAASIAAAIDLAQSSNGAWSTIGSLALGGFALAMLRGCPMCWTIGLFATVSQMRCRTR